MKIFVADKLENHTEIELISGKVGLFQDAITEKLFEEVRTLEQSDTILVPNDAFYFSKYPDYLKYLNQLSAKKPIIFSDRGDFPKKPKIQNSIALRVAINPGESIKNKVVVPYNVESLAHLPFRDYSPSPAVSFMGFMPRISPRRLVRTIRQSPFHPIQGNGAIIRALSHRTLQQSGLDYHFVLRGSYGALASGDSSVDKHRTEYINLLSESDFIASPRGDANQSARFYESLSAGRIPLVPFSSIVLPNLKCPAHPQFLGIYFQFLRNDLNSQVMEMWEMSSNPGVYHMQQTVLRDYYEKYLRFAPFIKRLFKLDFSELAEVTSL